MVFCIMWRPRLLGKINLILLTITKGENEIHLFRCMMKCLYYVLTIIWTHHFSFIFKKNYLKNVVFYKMFHIIHFINLLFQNESIVLIQNTKLLLCKLFKIGQNFQEINIYYFIGFFKLDPFGKWNKTFQFWSFCVPMWPQNNSHWVEQIFSKRFERMFFPMMT
jgi:hypothetical protein